MAPRQGLCLQRRLAPSPRKPLQEVRSTARRLCPDSACAFLSSRRDAARGAQSISFEWLYFYCRLNEARVALLDPRSAARHRALPLQPLYSSPQVLGFDASADREREKEKQQRQGQQPPSSSPSLKESLSAPRETNPACHKDEPETSPVESPSQRLESLLTRQKQLLRSLDSLRRQEEELTEELREQTAAGASGVPLFGTEGTSLTASVGASTSSDSAFLQRRVELSKVRRQASLKKARLQACREELEALRGAAAAATCEASFEEKEDNEEEPKQSSARATEGAETQGVVQDPLINPANPSEKARRFDIHEKTNNQQQRQRQPSPEEGFCEASSSPRDSPCRKNEEQLPLGEEEPSFWLKRDAREAEEHVVGELLRRLGSDDGEEEDEEEEAASRVEEAFWSGPPSEASAEDGTLKRPVFQKAVRGPGADCTTATTASAPLDETTKTTNSPEQRGNFDKSALPTSGAKTTREFFAADLPTPPPRRSFVTRREDNNPTESLPSETQQHPQASSRLLLQPPRFPEPPTGTRLFAAGGEGGSESGSASARRRLARKQRQARTAAREGGSEEEAEEPEEAEEGFDATEAECDSARGELLFPEDVFDSSRKPQSPPASCGWHSTSAFEECTLLWEAKGQTQNPSETMGAEGHSPRNPDTQTQTTRRESRAHQPPHQLHEASANSDPSAKTFFCAAALRAARAVAMARLSSSEKGREERRRRASRAACLQGAAFGKDDREDEFAFAFGAEEKTASAVLGEGEKPVDGAVGRPHSEEEDATGKANLAKTSVI